MVDFRAVAFLAALAISGSYGQDSIKLGDLLADLVTPDKQLLGGFQAVVDSMYKFDGNHLACGQRGLCHAMSLTSVTRRDGTTGVEAGILRQAVDGFGNVLFNLARPLMEAVGLGAVAREEVSFTNFLINMADSVIIEFTRVLAGRRVSRQFEEFSPVLTLVDPAVRLARGIPKAYIANMVDFVVDVTNIADRRGSGTYNLVRSAGMGYTFGGNPDDPVCSRLDLDDEGACGDGDGAFYPLTSLNGINKHQLGKIIRPTGDNPLLNRNHLANDVMQYNGFELGDIFNPKSLLCKTNNLLESMHTHVDVVESETEPNYYYLDEVDKEFASSEESEVYDHYDEDNSEFNVKSDSTEEDEELDEEEKMAVRVFKKVKKIEENERVAAQLDSNRRQITKPETNKDHFQDFCSQQNLKAKRAFMKKMKEEDLEATVTEVEDEDLEEEAVVEAPEEEENIDEVDTIVNVKKSEDSQLNDLEQLARLGDKSLLLERLEVEEGKEKQAAVEEYVASLNVTADGQVEKVVDVETKKKMLLVQFDSMTFRDAVLKASRSPGARSSSKARLRKPKVKDLKHVETLRH